MMRVWSSVVLIATCAAAVAAAQRPSRSVPIRQAVQIGAGMFEPGDTPSGGNGQPVDGIEGSSQEMLAVHIHAHLSIFDHGRQIAVPYAIGFVRPFRVENGFVGAARGIYWLHTHDATGIIHVESPDPRTYTLGNFFDIWGRPLTTTNVAGIEGPVHAYVDGKPHTGDPRAIVLRAHAQITLEVGTPLVTPPVYVFPEGL
jgi:hypothetical protein